MRLQYAWTLILALGGCSTDNEPGNPAPVDGGKVESGSSTDGSDAVADADHAAQVARGKYLIDHVAACGDCHTPRDPNGKPDPTRYLAGSAEPLADVVLGDDAGLGKIYARNLTPDLETGLGKWTLDQIKKAILDGVDDENKPLFPIMPYFVFHNMTSGDADAIVAYLRAIAPVNNAIPEREAVPGFTQPAIPVAVDKIPVTTLPTSDSNYAAAMRGRYLAGLVGACMDCHTTHVAGDGVVPLDLGKLFAGDHVFHLPMPFGDVHSSNITPDPNGIESWTAENVRDLLKVGTDDEGKPICPPMPAGAMRAFGGLTNEDALDIGYYLTTIKGIDNGTIPKCVPPVPDGGVTEGAADGEGGDAPPSDAAAPADSQAD